MNIGPGSAIGTLIGVAVSGPSGGAIGFLIGLILDNKEE